MNTGSESARMDAGTGGDFALRRSFFGLWEKIWEKSKEGLSKAGEMWYHISVKMRLRIGKGLWLKNMRGPGRRIIFRRPAFNALDEAGASPAAGRSAGFQTGADV